MRLQQLFETLRKPSTYPTANWPKRRKIFASQGGSDYTNPLIARHGGFKREPVEYARHDDENHRPADGWFSSYLPGSGLRSRCVALVLRLNWQYFL
jgi:hypothetical protein